MFKKYKKTKVDIQNGLNDEQLELLGNRIDQLDDDRSQIEPFDKSLGGEVSRFANKNRLLTVIIIIAAALLAFVLILSVIYGIVNNMKNNTDDFVFYVGREKYYVSYEDTVINDVVYLDMEYLAKLCDMTVSGDKESRKYTLPNYEYIRFTTDSEYVIINGEYVELVNDIFVYEDKCLVPFHFISKAIVGVNFSYDSKLNEVEISRKSIGIDKNNEKKYEEVSFSSNAFSKTNAAYLDYGFEDIDSVISAVAPANVSEGRFLLLVNHVHPLSADHKPSDLVQLTCATNPLNAPSYYKLRKNVAEALYAMLEAMESSGISGVQVSSSYRSYERQYERFEEDVALYMSRGMSRNEAEKTANKYLARPGHSEHQTGLCVDFVQGTKALTEKFENTDAFEWLSENAHKFGFILRYPKEKVEITGYGYEPWHFRFVGRTVASQIYEAGICLEEYFDI